MVKHNLYNELKEQLQKYGIADIILTLQDVVKDELANIKRDYPGSPRCIRVWENDVVALQTCWEDIVNIKPDKL